MFPPKILLLDDEQRALEALRRALHSKATEWDLTFLASPYQALKMAGERSFDVVVTDLSMPGIDGLALLERIKASGSQASCIVLTGTGDLDSAMDAINRIGVFRFFTKPCPTDRLIEGIGAALRSRSGRLDTGHLALDNAGTALDRLPIAVLALDSERRVIFMNRQGAGIIRDKRGLMVDAGGRCRTERSEMTRVLYDAIDSVLAGKGNAVLRLPMGDQEGSLTVFADTAGENCGDARILLFIQAQDQLVVPPADQLKSLFGLTNAEAELTRRLLQGCDLAEAAQECGLAISSARTYLKSIFAKTGTNRQAELMRQLLSATVIFWPQER